jgi:hypothetical protein
MKLFTFPRHDTGRVLTESQLLESMAENKSYIYPRLIYTLFGVERSKRLLPSFDWPNFLHRSGVPNPGSACNISELSGVGNVTLQEIYIRHVYKEICKFPG